MDPLRLRLRIYLTVFLTVMVAGTVGFAWTEGLALWDALYFSIVTMATVGYGDIHPSTPVGKLLSVFLIVFGVGTFMALVANAAELMLNRREKQARLERLNRVIGIFFSQLGTPLLGKFVAMDTDADALRNALVGADWSGEAFERVKQAVGGHAHRIQASESDLREARDLLREKTGLMLQLLESPNLVEHESFSDLLHAVLHIADELEARGDLHGLPETDRAHLEGDIRRAYAALVREWVGYMAHLKDHYPYLFSLASRRNPFDPSASPVVT